MKEKKSHPKSNHRLKEKKAGGGSRQGKCRGGGRGRAEITVGSGASDVHS